MKRTGLFWLQNDLRLHDHPGLWQMQAMEQLICVFCIDPAWYRPNGFNARALGATRYAFLAQALTDLSNQMDAIGQTLLVIEADPVEAIAELVETYQVSVIGRSQHPGAYENRQWQRLQQHFPDRDFYQADTATLFREQDLPFALADSPKTFSQFRKLVEDVPVNRPMSAIDRLPPPPAKLVKTPARLASTNITDFTGGEQAALQHLSDYFSGEAPAVYKEVRNELDGWQNSTKFSPWLAQGSLSVRTLLSRLRDYEKKVVANDSTYWIFFELLWREYFQWYAQRYGARLFRFNGISNETSRRCYYPERYQKWCHGNTPYPLVNALMNQLNETGYMSNRGRQIAASCFVYDLQLDWRFGAAYFEQQLLDYDVASNWGNWQYIAGVGADPRGGRRFNIDKQTRQYDPDGVFIQKWQGDTGNKPLDSVDAADWPIMPPGR